MLSVWLSLEKKEYPSLASGGSPHIVIHLGRVTLVKLVQRSEA